MTSSTEDKSRGSERAKNREPEKGSRSHFFFLRAVARRKSGLLPLFLFWLSGSHFSPGIVFLRARPKPITSQSLGQPSIRLDLRFLSYVLWTRRIRYFVTSIRHLVWLLKIASLISFLGSSQQKKSGYLPGPSLFFSSKTGSAIAMMPEDVAAPLFLPALCEL